MSKYIQPDMAWTDKAQALSLYRISNELAEMNRLKRLVLRGEIADKKELEDKA